jgi:hypothetical protein
MAVEQSITADDDFFAGEDVPLLFTIYADATQTTIQDVTGWALRWRLRKRDDSPVLVEKTTPDGITITGVFNASPALNTQVVTVTPGAADTVGLNPGAYRQRLDRTDTGLQTVLVFGDVALGTAS